MGLSERLLLARLRDRDEEAFNEIVRVHGDKVFNVVLRMVGNRAEAEDIAQEVFVTVFKSIDTFRGESKFSTWLLGRDLLEVIDPSAQ
jgi:RNA polymerase sigma-70 factor (ECF subfamily)